MQPYLDKSKKNLDAAKLLLTNSLPDPSIHCAYYACIQHMLYILYHKMGYDEARFYSEARNNKQGTHGYAAKLIGIELAKNDHNDYKWYQRHIKEFKELREKADYLAVSITNDECDKAIGESNSIIGLLKKYFTK